MDNQQKKASNKRGSEELTALVYQALDASVSGVVITDNRLPDNPIIYHNKAFEKITGYSSQEIVGRNCRFLQAGDRNQDVRKQIRDAIDEGRDVTVEIRNYRKDDELFWNELYMSPVKNDAGEITHFIGVQNDITARKSAEEKLIIEKNSVDRKVAERTEHLKRIEEYLTSIIQTIREGLVVLDPDFKIIKVNAAFLQTFKVTEMETLDKQLFDLGNGQWNIEKLRELLLEILPTNNPVLDFEVHHDFPHIGTKTMLLNAHRIEIDGEFKDRILLAIEDITDRKEIEKRKDDFLSIASHELKTPLTAVKGYFQLIKKFSTTDISKLPAILDKTDIQIDRLGRLIAELLDVSKIQSGKLELHHKVFHFDMLVQDTVEHLQLNFPDFKIRVSGSTDVAYNGDESQLAQVIENLVGNAIKYSPDNKQIDVYLYIVQNSIKFSVRDYGLGISMEDQKKIFDRFFRVGKIQKKFSGMGIGLYICQQIILQHGGSLWVDSEPGQGATFSFTLPLND